MSAGGLGEKKVGVEKGGEFDTETLQQGERLWTRLWPLIGAKPQAVEVAQDLSVTPQDPDLKAALRVELRKILDSDAGLAAEMAQLFAANSPGDTHYRVLLRGSGALAQGEGNVVASGLSRAAGRDLIENQTIIGGMPAADTGEAALRDAYLRRVAEQTGFISLAAAESAPAPDSEARLNLEAVYTALSTRAEHAAADERGDRMASRPSSALEEMNRHERLVLLGEPGSGKSTFVGFVALCHAGEVLGLPGINLERLTAPLPDEQGHAERERQPWDHGPLLPVRVVLRHLATKLPERGRKATAQDLWDALERDLREAGFGEYCTFLKRELLTRGGLLLLDGLDEVPEADTRRDQIRQVVEAFVEGFGKCRVLLTSRSYAYRNQRWRLPGFSEAVLAPFGTGQIRRFVRAWYAHQAAKGQLVPKDASAQAAQLERSILGNPRLRELAERPLLLTLMANLHASRGGELPQRREELYAEALELLLSSWERQRVTLDTNGKPHPSLTEFLDTGMEKVRGALQQLAYEVHTAQAGAAGTADIDEGRLVALLMHLSRNPEANPKRLVEYLRDRAGILESRGVGVYTFLHRTFQEYLAACHLTGDSFPDRVAGLGRAEHDRWREVVLLAGAKEARRSAATVWSLAEALCWREPDDRAAGAADAWGAQLAGQLLAESADLETVSEPNRLKLERIQRFLLRLIRDGRLGFAAIERAQAGTSLARLGDSRFDPELCYLPREPALGFVELPAGAFLMGSDRARDADACDDEMAPHYVQVADCALARYPVTVQQFAEFVERSAYELENRKCLAGLLNQPVVYITWYDALAYCRWLGERLRELAGRRLSEPLDRERRDFWQRLADGEWRVSLPSEAEWEKAARGTDGRIYPWGDWVDADRASFGLTGIGRPSPVGCFPGGASPYGCEEMAGNVWEWTRSLWGEDPLEIAFKYPYDLADGREDLEAPATVFRIVRGGSYVRTPRYIRCAYRSWYDPGVRDGGIGFRVMLHHPP